MKFVVDPPTGDAIRSYFNAAQASGDALASALFAVPGVTNVLIQPNWITVNKAPTAAWPAVRRGVEQALARAALPTAPTAPDPGPKE